MQNISLFYPGFPTVSSWSFSAKAKIIFFRCVRQNGAQRSIIEKTLAAVAALDTEKTVCIARVKQKCGIVGCEHYNKPQKYTNPALNGGLKAYVSGPYEHRPAD